MDFRLLYDGPLPSNAGPQVKHSIRKVFHIQLAQLWNQHRALQLAKERLSLAGGVGTFLSKLASKHSQCGFRFVPLVNCLFGMVCELDILFLRQGTPGNLILPGGDIDNRIKTLLDALRVPHGQQEIYGTPDPEEEPFFCLVEDDALITKVSVTTDRLLMPLKNVSSHPENDVFLVIQVIGKAGEPLTLGNVTFKESGKYT